MTETTSSQTPPLSMTLPEKHASIEAALTKYEEINAEIEKRRKVESMIKDVNEIELDQEQLKLEAEERLLESN